MPLPRRTLADWTPDAGPQDEWLGRWAEQGWRVEHGPANVVVAGTRRMRYAMIWTGEHDDQQHDRQSAD